MTRYEQGRRYEYKKMKELREDGWNVTRSAGSHGDFDLIAIRNWTTVDSATVDSALGYVDSHTDGLIKLIQLKTGKSKKRAISEVEKTDIGKWEGLYSVSVEVV